MRLKAPIWKMMLRWVSMRALGGTGGARGVDDDGHVAGLRRSRCGPPIPCGCSARRFAAERDELVERHHLRVGEAAQALHVEHDDLSQARRALAHGQDLVELLLVLHEQVLGVAVVDEVLDLRRRVGRDRCRSRRPRRTARRGRRTATPCCCRTGWRRARRAAAPARSAPSRSALAASPYCSQV